MLGSECENVETSMQYASFFWNFNCKIEGIKEFLINLSQLLHRQTKERNCLETVSPPSASKNCFLDHLLIFMGKYRTLKAFTIFI